ncbi:cell wall-binding repeat-containing protein [Peptostreptococcus sp.]|uniref:cell wall-binding repeat-containing protein n=1 Tax=Peptostreptococcus sp. TaxID=1262 RepID=UPI002FCA5ADD
MKEKIKRVVSLGSALALTVSCLSVASYAVEKNDDKVLPKEPTETTVTVDKFVPRIGDEITFSIDNFGYENTEDKIGTDYGVLFYNYEEVDKYKPSFTYNNNAQVFQKMALPSVKVERYEEKTDKWIDSGTDLNLSLFLRDQSASVGHYTSAPNEKKEHTIYREDVLKTIKDSDSYLGSLKQYTVFINSLDDDGKPFTPGKHLVSNRISTDGPIKVTYKIEDNETKQKYATLQGVSSWFKNENVNKRYEVPYPINWLYYETSDIKLSLDEPMREFKAGDTIKLKVEIENTSKNLPNSRLISGIDFGKKEGSYPKEGDKTDIELEYGTDNPVIKEEVGPGQKITKHTEIKLPDEIKPEYLQDGKLVLTPFLLTSNMDNSSGKTVAYKNLKEREYNEPLYLSFDKEEGEENGSNGGSGGGGDTTSKNNVILASGDKYTDVLTATVLGNEKKCPILLSEKNKVSDNTLNEMKRLDTDTVIISGGPESVSDNVVNQLKKEGYDVRRIAGQNRYETAKKIGNEVRLTTKNMNEAVLVDGTNFPDVITMSALANEKRVPILLTEPKALNNTTEKTLKDWNIENVTIGGEKISVSQDVENSVKSNVKTVDRIGGHDRYETAYKVADEVRSKTNNKNDMILVDGTNFPDGITISSLAAKFKAPILLTTPDTLHPTTAKAINDWTIENILIGGGYNSVSKSIEDNLGAKNKERVAGSNRYNTAVEISKRYTNSTSLGKN